MPIKFVSTRKTKKKVKQLLGSVPEKLTESGDNQWKDIFWGTVAYHLFTKIHHAYMVKSEHGRDDLGNSWEDLTKHYKAYGRSDRGALTRNQRRKRNMTEAPGLLTPNQYKRWKQVFHVVARNNKKKMGLQAAEEYAGKVAWTVIKREGGETLIDVLGDRQLQMMVVTGRLEKSLRPGRLTTRKYFPRPEQWYEVDDTGLVLGSDVEYADQLTDKRPIIPKDLGIWLDEAIEKGVEALTDLIQKELR